MAMVAPAIFAGAASAYTLSVKNGMLPGDVIVANLNSLDPATDGYKRGWTKEGWTVDRFGDRGYILVSPTFTKQEMACANSLSLPAQEIAAGDFLSWDVRSALPDFPEAYIVTAREEGAAIDATETIWEENSTSGEWTSRVVALDKYVGKSVIFEFRATSVNRYMLCLDKVTVAPLADYAFATDRTSPVFFDKYDMAHGRVAASLDITNIGRSAENGTFECRIDGKTVANHKLENIWKTGETRQLSFALPVVADERQAYSVVYVADGSETPVYAGEYFCSIFRPHLMVDKGTGTWCVNCPEANLSVAQLEKRFGDYLVMLETHNGDVMANDSYFNDLAYRSIPYWMLNRIQGSRGEKPAKFDEYAFRPCNWDIRLTEATSVDNEKIKVSVTATYESELGAYDSSFLNNYSDRYRIGYVLTSDFSDPGNASYQQRNNSTQPGAEQYYYLPSLIPSELMKYHNVTLTYESAFTGFEKSLPEQIISTSKTEFSFEIERPELLADLNKGRVVVFILDTETGEVLNSFAGMVGADFANTSAESISEENYESVYPSGVWNLQGIRVADTAEGLPTGIYIIGGKKIKI